MLKFLFHDNNPIYYRFEIEGFFNVPRQNLLHFLRFHYFRDIKSIEISIAQFMDLSSFPNFLAVILFF